MNKALESPENRVLLSAKQTVILEHTAKVNKTTPAHLVSLAVDALLAEAARNEGWLPIPKPASDLEKTPEK